MSPSEFQNLPGSVKAGGTALGAGGLLALMWKYHDQAAALLIILIGVIVVIAAVIAFSKVGALKMKGKSKSFKDELGTKLRATPGGVIDADARAKLDDLRRSLQGGMEKLQATGKNLYILPWYLMVGEPGSGKTKAIAAAGVSLPGFQDPLQGAGGTVNMNWWFTNNGIILDTAGRLMLPEVNTGNNPEWDEFLRTLNRKRPNCPINGLILAVPADTLITDTATEIDRKAGDIAYQFNKLQVTLGIRFPVFVLITKSDKILGFREFFESVNQPDEQAQLLGWSNPEKLDDAFKPELVEEHLTKVHEQLVRRRARLIQDPVHTDDPNSRRLDQIDALYELPEAMVSLAPRLRRYLEPIFVAGPLSAKPLFLRGIYFTSSLQTGEAVDAAMAAIMGNDIAKSHGGAVVSEKPYFLKHVFQEKVFKEKGLVTRTTNVSHLKRRRKMAVLVAGIASVLALTGFTWFSRNQLDRDLGDHVAVWEGVQKWGEKKDMEMVGAEDGRYHGQNKGNNKYTLTQLHQRARQEIPTAVHVPVVFKPVAKMSADLDTDRRQAYTAFYEGKVLLPVVTRARGQMQASIAEQWSPDATAALRQLILLEAKQPLAPVGTAKESFSLDGLVPYVLDPQNKEADRKAWDADKQSWTDNLHWVYAPAPDGAGATWPPAALAANSANGTAIAKGIDSFIKYTDAQAEASKNQREAVRAVASKLEALDKAERALLDTLPEILKNGGDKWDSSKPSVAQWRDLRPPVESAKLELDGALKALETQGWKQPSATEPGLASFYQKIVQGTIDQQLKDYDSLLTAIPSQDTSDQVLADARTQLSNAKVSAEKARKAAEQDSYATTLSNLEKIMLNRLPGDNAQPRLYEAQFEIISVADKQLPAVSPSPQVPPDFDAAYASIENDLVNTNKRLAGYRAVVMKDGRESKLCDLADALDQKISFLRRRSVLLEIAVKDAPEKLEDWVDRLKAVPLPAGDPIVIPVTAGIDEHFPLPERDPRRLSGVQTEWTAALTRGSLTAAIRPPDIMDWDDLAKIAKEKQKGFKALRDQFAAYWKTGYRADWELKRGDKVEPWTDVLRPKLINMNVDTVNASIKAFLEMRAQAMALLAPTAAAPEVGSADPRLSEKVHRRLEYWAKLPEDAGKARVALLALSELTRAERFLLVPGQDVSTPITSPSYEDYWTNLFVAALDSVGHSAEERSKIAFKSLWEDYRHFPLAPPDPDKEVGARLDELSPKQLEAACGLIEEVWGPWQGKAPAAAAPVDHAISDSDLFRIPMMHLRAGGGLPTDDQQLKWAESVHRLQPWLVALRDKQVNCRFSFLRMAEDGANLSTYYPYGEIQVNKAALVDQKKQTIYNLRYFEPGADILPPEGLIVKGGQGPVILALRVNVPGNVGATIPLGKGNWSQLRLVIEVGKDAKDRSVTHLEAKNSWKVTFHHRPKEGVEQNIDYKVTLAIPDEDLSLDFWNK